MGVMDVTAESLAAMFKEIGPHLDERQRRLLMGAQARALGHGGIRLVAGAAGVREATVSLGAAELASGAEPLGRARRPGGGARRARDKDPGLVPALLALVEPEERGDPESPLRWTVKSTRNLAGELTRQGRKIGADTVGDLLREEGFSLQGNVKTMEGKQHPDRDAQFRYIAAQAGEHMAAGQPVISVDAKKREQVGPFARPGRQWRPAGDPVRVRDHSFPDEELGVVIPYGITTPSSSSGKLWSRTLTGSPAGRHCRPGRANGPTCSRFLASTLITGCPAAMCSPACAAMYRNWASRSGCCFPSIVLTLPCRLNPSSRSRSPTVSAPILRPCRVSSPARLRVDLTVHRSGDSGSPRSSGSTSASSAGTSPGSLSRARLAPPPGRRARPSGSAPEASSAAPSETVASRTPAAPATSRIPPWPSARACAPISSRRCRSSRWGPISLNIAASDSAVTSMTPIPHHQPEPGNPTAYPSASA